MNPLDWSLKGRFGAAFRAGAGFVAVSLVGAIGLVVVGIVLWAASLTPFGAWAGVPVIAAGALVAYVLWRKERGESVLPRRASASRTLSSSPGPARWPERPIAEGAARPRLRLIGGPDSGASRGTPLIRQQKVPDAEDLKRQFDQAFAGGRFDETERMLQEIALMPGQADWVRRKQRLVRQQRARL